MLKLKQSFLTIVIGLALAAGLSYAWTGPTATPPNNNASAPINVSSLSQIKDGPLQVNGFRNIGNSIFDGSAEFKSNVGVGIGAVLTVNGRLRILDGTQTEGRVLTSDDNGYSTWRQPSEIQTQLAPQIQTVKGTGGSAYCPGGFIRVGCSGSRQVDLADTCDEDECGYIGTHPVEPNGCVTGIDPAGGTASVAIAYCLKF